MVAYIERPDIQQAETTVQRDSLAEPSNRIHERLERDRTIHRAVYACSLDRTRCLVEISTHPLRRRCCFIRIETDPLNLTRGAM